MLKKLSKTGVSFYKNSLNLIGLLILGVLLSVPSQALNNFRINEKDDFSKILPKSQSLNMALLSDKQKIVNSTITVSVDDENIIEYKNEWPEGEYTAYLNKDLSFRKSIKLEKKTPATVKASIGNSVVDLPYNKRVVEYNPKTKKMNITYFLNEKQQTEFDLTVDKNNIDMDLIGLYFQTLFYKKSVEPFNCDIVIPDMRRTLNVDITIKKTKSLCSLSPEYEFPQKLKTISNLSEESTVFIVQATGLTAMFYPHRFYLFYDEDSPYSLIAWWGGAPKEVLFFVSKDQLLQ